MPGRGATMMSFVLAGILGADPMTAVPHPRASLQVPAPSEKASRTAAQQKINSQLLYEIYRVKGIAVQKQVPPGKTGVKIDKKGRALVDVRADVRPGLEKTLRGIEGTIVSTSAEYHSIIVWLPLLKLEQLAEDAAIRAIEPAPEATVR